MVHWPFPSPRIQGSRGLIMHEFCLKSQEGRPTPADREELALYRHAGHILDMLRSKARRSLRGDGAPFVSHRAIPGPRPGRPVRGASEMAVALRDEVR